MTLPPDQPQARQEKGERGFELDAQITLPRPRSAEEVHALLRGFHARVEPYGTDEVRVVRVTGKVASELARSQLRALLESGDASRIEVGLHGFLRSVTGQTDWIPWRRNVILGRGEWAEVAFEEGLRYVLE